MNKEFYNKLILEKDKFIGGKLEDLEYGVMTTKIIDIKIDGNFFEVVGKDFSCGFDFEFGCVLGWDKEEKYIVFNTRYCGNFTIEMS